MSRFFPSRSYGLVLKRGRFFSPQARRFINLVRAHAKPENTAAALQNKASPPINAG